jgi:non-specific serine/threonine protein kinase/serine/threonine-protein kinase
MARHDLAQISFRETRPDDAAGLLGQAQAFWAGEPRRYRSELLDSRLLQSQLERTGGDIDLAVRTLEDALPQRIELSGRTHRDTAVLVNNLGNAYFQAGRLEDAATQFRQAHGLWRELGQDRSADALNTLNNWAAVEARLSRPQVAIGIMEDALALRRELYGPSAAMAALMNNLGKTLSQLARHEEAIPLLREAIEMGRIHAGGETGAIALAASLGLADALSGSGHPQRAWELIDEVGPGILETYGSAHVLSAMLDISRARAHHAGGAVAAAQAALAQARSGLVALGPAGAGALQQLEILQQGWSDQARASE